MKILRTVFIALLVLAAIVLVIAAISPKTFHAGSEIIIHRNATEVFDFVKYLKNQGEFDPWSRQDPNIQKEYLGEDGTVGFTYTWKSNKVGNGRQVIKQIIEGRRLDIDIYFNDNKQANHSFIEVDSIAPQQSSVRWEIEGRIPFPFNIMNLVYDMDEDFKQGLINLKSTLEK